MPISGYQGEAVGRSDGSQARGMRGRRQSGADCYLLRGIFAMADSTLAVAAFGGDKALLATDQTAGVHTIKVTTDAPSDGLAIWGFGAAKIVLGTVRSGGVHTLCVTTDAPDSAVVLAGAMGAQVRVNFTCPALTPPAVGVVLNKGAGLACGGGIAL